MDKIKSLLRENYLKIIVLLILVVVYVVLYKIYIPRVSAFGCFDDCNNFMRGYFVLNGKHLFLEVFSGHQPLGSYLSTLIQFISSPQNIFELVLRHRQFILLLGFLFNSLLIIRFGYKFIFFVIIFELSKFYLFGDRFLAENMIVYPIVYLMGIVLLKFNQKKVYFFDYLFAALFCWFIVFAREPYIPLALFMYLIFIFYKFSLKNAIFSLSIFTLLSLVTIFIHDAKEYFFNVIEFNFIVNVPADATPTGLPGPKILQIFFYPIYSLFFGKANIFSYLLTGVSFIFCLHFITLIKQRKYKIAAFIFIALGLANIRVVFPGFIFYYAFHMSVWYGMLIFILIYLLFNETKNKIVFNLSLILLGLIFTIFIFSPKYFAWEKIDVHAEFITNYGSVLQEGEVIKILSKPDDSLFLDASDDLIYWQSKRFSQYKYAWYTSSMPTFSLFRDERTKMFKNNPPDFYREYGFCFDKQSEKYLTLPNFVTNDYIRLESEGRPSCIFIRKDKIKEITQDQWDEAAKWHFSLPNGLKN